MTITLLKKQHARMRLRKFSAPLSSNVVLGSGIDVTTMPDCHLCCSKCNNFYFEAWIFLDNRRIEMGCMGCGHMERLLFPIDLDLKRLGPEGRFICTTHPKRGMVFIKCQETVCIGCEKCYTEIQIKVRTKNNLVITDTI